VFSKHIYYINNKAIFHNIISNFAIINFFVRYAKNERLTKWPSKLGNNAANSYSLSFTEESSVQNTYKFNVYDF